MTQTLQHRRGLSGSTMRLRREPVGGLVYGGGIDRGLGGAREGPRRGFHSVFPNSLVSDCVGGMNNKA